jgi:TPR repeat protein
MILKEKSMKKTFPHNQQSSTQYLSDRLLEDKVHELEEESKEETGRLSTDQSEKEQRQHVTSKKKDQLTDVESDYQLGLQYYHGLSRVKIHYFKAFEHFKQAANHDHPLVRVYTGICYLTGRGTTIQKELGLQKIQAGLPRLKVLAKQGEVTAQHRLAYLYHKGWCVKQDYLKALQWYEKAANRGDKP